MMSLGCVFKQIVFICVFQGFAYAEEYHPSDPVASASAIVL